MADTSLTHWTIAPISVHRPDWLDALAHRTEILRRRARRDRYLALIGRSPRRYPWLEAMVGSMTGG